MIKVLAKSFAILETIRTEGASSLGDIAEATGYPKTTLLTIAKTLVHLGYLGQDGSGRYQATGKLERLGVHRSEFDSFKEDLRVVVPLIGTALGENASSLVFERDLRHVLATHEGGRLVRLLDESIERDFYTFASGRLFLAFMESSRSAALVKRWGIPGRLWPEIRKEADFRPAFERIRKTGYEIVRYDDVVALAVPVRPKGRAWLGALGAYTGITRWKKGMEERMLVELRQRAEEIEAKWARSEAGRV